MNWKVVVTVAAMSLTLCSASPAADEGAALYKSKCSGCHARVGRARQPSTRLLSREPAWMHQITEHITKGESTSTPPHNKGTPGVSDELAKSIADCIKTLK
jgi:cytochrome c553